MDDLKRYRDGIAIDSNYGALVMELEGLTPALLLQRHPFSRAIWYGTRHSKISPVLWLSLPYLYPLGLIQFHSLHAILSVPSPPHRTGFRREMAIARSRARRMEIVAQRRVEAVRASYTVVGDPHHLS